MSMKKPTNYMYIYIYIYTQTDNNTINTRVDNKQRKKKTDMKRE